MLDACRVRGRVPAAACGVGAAPPSPHAPAPLLSARAGRSPLGGSAHLAGEEPSPPAANGGGGGAEDAEAAAAGGVGVAPFRSLQARSGAHLSLRRRVAPASRVASATRIRPVWDPAQCEILPSVGSRPVWDPAQCGILPSVKSRSLCRLTGCFWRLRYRPLSRCFAASGRYCRSGIRSCDPYPTGVAHPSAAAGLDSLNSASGGSASGNHDVASKPL